MRIRSLPDLLFQSARRRNRFLVWLGGIQKCFDKNAPRFRSQTKGSILAFGVPVFVAIRHKLILTCCHFGRRGWERERKNTRTRETCFIASSKQNSRFLDCVSSSACVRRTFARNDSC